MTALPDSVALAVPDVWDNVPMGQSQFKDYVKAQRRRLADSGTVSRSTLRQVELANSCLYQLARANRVILVSNYVAVEQRDSGQQGDDIVTMAGLVMSALRRTDIGTNIPLMAELMVKAFSEHEIPADVPVRFDEIEPPAMCHVAGIEAAKLVRLMTISGEPGQEFKQFTQTYLVSVAKGDAVIVLQFSTINLEYARQFSELFEKIAGTLRVLYPDDPTFLDDDTSDTIEPVAS